MIDLTPRQLQGTDLRVGPVVVGTMTFGEQLDERESAAVVARARELGLTMFDSANSYTGGRSEELLGRLVAPFRDEVLLVSKVGADRAAAVGTRRSAGDPAPSRLDAASIRQHCDASLQRLGTDRLDLYYLHMPDHGTPLEESLAACDELVRAGKVRHLGMSNYPAWQVAEAVRLTEQHGWAPVRVTQPVYNLLARRIEEEYLPCTAHHGISNLVYGPLAGGMLTGKHRFAEGPVAGTRFDLRATYQDRYWRPQVFAAVEQLRGIAAQAGTTLVSLAYRWLLGRPGVNGILLGITSLEQFEANLAAFDGPPLDADTLSAIDGVWADLAGAAPSYHR